MLPVYCRDIFPSGGYTCLYIAWEGSKCCSSGLCYVYVIRSAPFNVSLTCRYMCSNHRVVVNCHIYNMQTNRQASPCRCTHHVTFALRRCWVSQTMMRRSAPREIFAFVSDCQRFHSTTLCNICVAPSMGVGDKHKAIGASAYICLSLRIWVSATCRQKHTQASPSRCTASCNICVASVWSNRDNDVAIGATGNICLRFRVTEISQHSVM